MKTIYTSAFVWLAAFIGSTVSAQCLSAQETTLQTPEARIQFSRDILPILSNKCFRCHGPDEAVRQAGFRLDVRDEAMDSGAIVPGDIDDSELIARITHSDDGERMPPADSSIESITDREAELIRQWIQQGAEWETHWAFVPIASQELPSVKDKDWVNNPIDQFVLARLEANNLQPSTPADKSTLLRRASLLITGLPPSPGLTEEFLSDTSPEAYEKLVNQLFASSAYGERMAAVWMELARYSDTDGFQGDEPRSNWPWRDWVVDAYHNNMPFDQFTIEQFAGDLLAEPTNKQVLATCFHRNHMTNGEGGRDPAESRVDYVLDRVNTVGTVWLGLTLGCAQCHTHKYDPVTQKEYYQLTAFFNSIDEDGKAGKQAKPYLDWPMSDPKIALKEPLQLVENRQQELNAKTNLAIKNSDESIRLLFEQRGSLLKNSAQADWNSFQVKTASATDKAVVFEAEDDDVWRIKKGNPNNETYTLTGVSRHASIGAIRVQALPHESFTDGGLSRSNSGNFVLTDVVVHIVRDKERTRLNFGSAWADYSQPGFPVEEAIDPMLDSGWAVWSGDMTQPRTAIFRFVEPVELQDDDQIEIQLIHFSHNPGHNIGRFRISMSPIVEAAHETEITKVLAAAKDENSLSMVQRELLQSYLVGHDADVKVAGALLNRARKDLERARRKSTMPVMVLKERETPRETFVLKRGVWDAHGDAVNAGTPAALHPVLPPSESNTRLDLARWLFKRENPLTARVAVNRYWQMYFGAGLVRTPQDFGLQGEQPTHPELLDWLAVNFIESGWDIKKTHKLIAMSATFQQSSVNTSELLRLDPDNRLLARGPRFRMPASMIRDNALAVSGLLSRRFGGPPVKPYQPDDVWSVSDQGKYSYELSTGRDLYRRSLYTYWRRNIVPTGMFDAAERRVCEVNIRRTNSPMHALVLLNDTTYVEAARVLAQSVLRSIDAKDTTEPEQVINTMVRRILAREASSTELNRLSESYVSLKKVYADAPDQVNELLRHGERRLDENLDPIELAAWTVVASVLLNLDETLNIE